MEQTEAKHEHKRPNYLIISGILFVVTVVEVFVPQVLGEEVALPALIFLMTLKVVLVAMYYMHLRSDSRWYTALILSPIPFVALIITALLVS